MSFVKSKIALLLCLMLLTMPLNISANEKKIALTFDDGPHYKYTEQILDILKKYDVKATFFTVGTNAQRFPELIEREIAEGHEIANHTFSHKHMKELDQTELEQEILKCEAVINEHGEEFSKLFRPPEGILSEDNRKTVEKLGYTTVFWDIDTRDWAHTPVNDIVANVLKNSKNGSVILFHDFVSGKSPTPEAIEILIPKLKEMGFSFVTVSQIKK